MIVYGVWEGYMMENDGLIAVFATKELAEECIKIIRDNATELMAHRLKKGYSTLQIEEIEILDNIKDAMPILRSQYYIPGEES